MQDHESEQNTSILEAIQNINARLAKIEARLDSAEMNALKKIELTNVATDILKHAYTKVEIEPANLQNPPDLLIISPEPKVISEVVQPGETPGWFGSKDNSNQKKNIETQIGLYWLNRLGVGSLVIGMAMLIIYSFQYFGAAAKIATGFVIAAGLLGLGEWMEKRDKSNSWYARGLMGGGWALAYFSVYAMHFIESVRIIYDPLTAVCLLLAVASMAILHSLQKRSQIVATLSVVLAFITIPLTPPGALTTSAAGILTIATAYLSGRMHWRILYFCGLCMAYISAFATLGHGTAPGGTGSLTSIKSALLLTNWLSFAAVAFYMPETLKKGLALLIGGATISALCFYFGMSDVVHGSFGANEFIFPLLLGAVYLLMARQLSAKALPAQSTTHLTLGVALVTAAIPQAIHGQLTPCILALEVLALTILGLQYKIASLRWFAFSLWMVAGSVILFDCGSDYQQNIGAYLIRGSIITCLFGAVSFVAAALLHHSDEYLNVQPQGERLLLFGSYFIGGLLLYALIPLLILYPSGMPDAHLVAENANHWLPLLWVAQASSIVALGFHAKSRLIRLSAVFFFFVALSTLLALSSNWSWPGTITAAALIYGCSYLYQKHRLDIVKDSAEGILQLLYSIAATAVITTLLGVKLQAGLVSAGWAIEGMLLLVAGFTLPQKSFRVMGLCVFALVAFKLLLIDLAGAETVQRIASFIGAGVILLISSYAYSKFAQKLTGPKAGDTAESLDQKPDGTGELPD